MGRRLVREIEYQQLSWGSCNLGGVGGRDLHCVVVVVVLGEPPSKPSG